jgi:hypothetical protein
MLPKSLECTSHLEKQVNACNHFNPEGSSGTVTIVLKQKNTSVCFSKLSALLKAKVDIKIQI